MTPAGLSSVRTSYLGAEPLEVAGLPAGTRRVRARSALGSVGDARLTPDRAVLTGLRPGTYAIEAWSADDRLLAEELTNVVTTPGERPVPGFATSYQPDAVPGVLDWLRALRCTTVQCYDWMERYAAPLAGTDDYCDRLGRSHSLPALRALAAGCREFGAVPQGYAPVYAADPDFAGAHPDMLLYRGDGEPERLGDLLQITNPANLDWQRHWLAAYGTAADGVGFGGFHLDTYGYPRAPLGPAGEPVQMAPAHAAFLRAVRTARPADVLSFNQVNGEPARFPLAGRPGYRYIEVWPPNDKWRHLEGLLARSAADSRGDDAVLAVYPPVWDGSGDDALRTVVLTEAIATTLGAGLLVWGDAGGCLQDPYYPDYTRLTDGAREQVLTWHRFALRCRDLFTGGTDTSWLDIADENGAVSVSWDGPVSPEPAGRTVYARVVRHEDHCIAVSVLDLTGSADGSWRSATAAGCCTEVTVTVLAASPVSWQADAAVLGQHGGRFVPVRCEPGSHREGLAIRVRLPLTTGWSVLRLTRT
jgi:dextranase